MLTDGPSGPRHLRPSIEWTIAGFLVLPVLGAVVISAVFVGFVQATHEDIALANQIGRQRYLATHLALQVERVGDGDHPAAEALEGHLVRANAAAESLFGAGRGGLHLASTADLDRYRIDGEAQWAGLVREVQAVAQAPHTAASRADGVDALAVAVVRDADLALVEFERHRSRERQVLWAVASLSVAFTLGVLVFGVFWTRRFVVEPLRSLRAAATAIEGGDLFARAPAVHEDEIADVARTFNLMADQVARVMSRLEQESAHADMLLSRLPVGVLLLGDDLTIVAGNPAFDDLRGRRTFDTLARRVGDTLGVPAIDPWLTSVLASSGRAVTERFSTASSDAQGARHLRVTASVVEARRPDEELVRVLVVVEDITAEERREADLRSLEVRFAQVIDHTHDGIVLIDGDGRVHYANPSAACRLGWDPERIVGRVAAEVVPWDIQAAAGDAADGLPVHRRDRVEATLQGSRSAVLEVSSSSYWDGGQRWLALLFRDVTEQERALSRLQESERTFRTLIEVAPDAVLVVRPEGVVTYANAAAARWLGYGEAKQLVGVAVRSIFVAGDVGAGIGDADAAPGQASVGELRVRHREGTVRAWEVARLRMEFEGGPAVLLVGRDVTDRKEVAARMMQMDRMISIGTLAAGVGHEINNPLTYVIANLEHVGSGLAEVRSALASHASRGAPGSEAEAEVRGWLGRVLDLEDAISQASGGAERVRQVVRDLRAFSREEESAPTSVEVIPVVESVLQMAWNEVRHRARLVRDLRPVPPALVADARLGQVILNLIVNAAHAIPDGRADENSITVRTRNEPPFVVIEVQDTGCGMPPHVLERVFEPFFTTKPVGQGTGLGLAIVQSLVTAWGGAIAVDSAVGVGTTFRVTLPAATTPSPALRRASVAPDPELPPAKHARVLIIDDEALVGRSLARSLTGRGVVVCEMDAISALRRLTDGESFDVIFCDLMMPDMSGMDFYWVVLRDLPQYADRIVFLTGGAFTASARDFLQNTKNLCLEKPFRPDRIREVVDSMVRSGASTK